MSELLTFDWRVWLLYAALVVSAAFQGVEA